MTHLIALAGGWSLWRWACLRGAGFPARLVLELAAPELAAVADRVLDLEAEAAERRLALIAACKAAIEKAVDLGADRRALQNALRRLWQHRVPEPVAEPEAEAARGRLVDSAARLDERARELARHHGEAQRAASAAIRRVAADDRFRQALLWQNRSAVTAGVDWLLRRPAAAGDSETRSKERLVASYLQRYCVKNDTIGFFGPCGWARFVDDPIAIAQRPGPSLVAGRTIYYEYWAIDALAARLAADPPLRPFLAPRRLPHCRLDGAVLHHGVGKRSELPAEFAAIAARCDGVRRARDIARELAGDPVLGGADEDDVLGMLDDLVTARVISWTLEIPTGAVHPERQLAALLDRIDDTLLRDRARAELDGLDRARAAVAGASDASGLASALNAFDAAFTEATGAGSHREHGRTYAARTPLYEECRRDLDVEIGRPLLDRVAQPLALLLASARWFTHEIAMRYRGALGAIHRRLRADGEPVEFPRFWQEVPALFPGGAAPGSIVGEVRAELHRRWAAVLAIDPADAGTVRRSAAALTAAVHERFAAPGPGWPAARHHSPDLMIAAAGPDALARGEATIVVGEMHTGFNTIVGPFLKLHPSPDELVRARDADIDGVGIAPVWSKAVTGADYTSPSPGDLDLETGETRSARPRSQVLATSDLVVAVGDRGLEVSTRDGARRFDIIAFLEHHLIAESFSAFSPIAPAPRTPRVMIDDVVIARATWRFAPAELAWPAQGDPAARFLAARRWARASGMPRWAFVRTAEEVKPVYVDFDSAIYVELLAKQLRGASAASLSEMLPAVGDTWLVDAAGARYTAELRVAAVDPAAWSAPQPEPPGDP